jgi:hypothetical protein
MAGDIRGRDSLLAWFGELKSKGFWLNEHERWFYPEEPVVWDTIFADGASFVG